MSNPLICGPFSLANDHTGHFIVGEISLHRDWHTSPEGRLALETAQTKLDTSDEFEGISTKLNGRKIVFSYPITEISMPEQVTKIRKFANDMAAFLHASIDRSIGIGS